MIRYTCDNCEIDFSDNESGVIIEDDYTYCCSECEAESTFNIYMTKGCDDYHAMKDMECERDAILEISEV